MAFLMLAQDILCTTILLVNHSQNFVVHHLSGCLTIGFLERIFLIIIITNVRQLITHTSISYHAVSRLGSTFKVVHSTCRDMSCKQIFGSTTSKQRTHLVKHLFFRRDNTLFRQIPCSTEGLTTRNDSYLYEWVGMLTEPTDSSMTCFVYSDSALLITGHHLCFLL